MAIVRQQRQVGIKRIGVINTDTGAARAYQSMAQAGQNLVRSALPQLQAEAERRGTNAAKEINRQNLIEFDAEGNPKALKVPENFGTIAASAYQTVIERRFNESMAEEIQNKSNELATKFTSDGKINVQGYSDQMASYLSAMDKASGGRFNEFISNTGQSVMLETQGKLQIAAAKKAKEDAEQAAKLNTFTALKQYRSTSVSVINPESIKNLYALEQKTISSIQQEFALTGDFVQYYKNLETADLAKAAAYTNLLSNSAKNLSDSERKIVTAAIENRAFVSQIEDPLVKNYVIKLHNLAPTNLTTLRSSFKSNIDALESIASAIDDEYFSQPSVIESLEDFQTTEWSDTNATLNAGERLLTNAPDSAKKKLQEIILSRVAQRFSIETENYFTGESPEENKILLLNLESALSSADELTDAFEQLPEGKVKNAVKLLLQEYNFDDRQLILKRVKATVDPNLTREELEFEAQQKETQAEEDALQIEADEFVIAQSTKIQSALDADNPNRALQFFNELQSQTLENTNKLVINNLSQPVRNNYIKLRESLEGKISTIEANQLREKSELSLDERIQELKKAEGFSEATVIYNQLQRDLKTNISGLKAGKIGEFRTQIDSAYQKFINEKEQNQIKANENEAKLLKEELEDIADNGDLISPEKLKEVQKKAQELVGDNTDLYNKLNSSFETSYARGYINTLQTNLVELTDNKGISPSTFSRILNMSLDQINDLEEGAVKKIAALLNAAKKPFDAKSEIRTRINEIKNFNDDLFNNFMNEVETQQSIAKVKTGQAEKADIEIYDNEIYANLAGVDKGMPIDFDAIELQNEKGELTPMGQQLTDDFTKGIIVPSVAKYLDRAAQRGVASDNNVFKMFQLGAGVTRYGDTQNIWNHEGEVQLKEKTIARLGAAILLYNAGRVNTPADGLAQIVANADEAGGDILKSVEATLGKDIDAWINDTYSGINTGGRKKLKEAIYALGFGISSGDDLKDRLDDWVDIAFGTDNHVIGARINQDKVVGARGKYLTTNGMERMTTAGYQLLYEAFDPQEQKRLFTELSTTRTAAELAAMQLMMKFAPQFAQRGTPTSDRAVVEERTFRPNFKLQFKESTAAPGIYYLYVDNVQQFKGSIPLVLDAFEFKEFEKAIPNAGYYNNNYRSALQNDPNGARYGRTNWFEIFGQRLGLFDREAPLPQSQATIDAEEAMIFARFPERINDNREAFDRLVEKGVILPEHVPNFMEYVNE